MASRTAPHIVNSSAMIAKTSTVAAMIAGVSTRSI
jgi:hypothetical protein